MERIKNLKICNEEAKAIHMSKLKYIKHSMKGILNDVGDFFECVSLVNDNSKFPGLPDTNSESFTFSHIASSDDKVEGKQWVVVFSNNIGISSNGEFVTVSHSGVMYSADGMNRLDCLTENELDELYKSLHEFLNYVDRAYLLMDRFIHVVEDEYRYVTDNENPFTCLLDESDDIVVETFDDLTSDDVDFDNDRIEELDNDNSVNDDLTDENSEDSNIADTFSEEYESNDTYDQEFNDNRSDDFDNEESYGNDEIAEESDVNDEQYESDEYNSEDEYEENFEEDANDISDIDFGSDWPEDNEDDTVSESDGEPDENDEDLPDKLDMIIGIDNIPNYHKDKWKAFQEIHFVISDGDNKSNASFMLDSKFCKAISSTEIQIKLETRKHYTVYKSNSESVTLSGLQLKRYYTKSKIM